MRPTLFEWNPFEEAVAVEKALSYEEYEGVPAQIEGCLRIMLADEKINYVWADFVNGQFEEIPEDVLRMAHNCLDDAGFRTEYVLLTINCILAASISNYFEFNDFIEAPASHLADQISYKVGMYVLAGWLDIEFIVMAATCLSYDDEERYPLSTKLCEQVCAADSNDKEAQKDLLLKILEVKSDPNFPSEGSELWNYFHDNIPDAYFEALEDPSDLLRAGSMLLEIGGYCNSKLAASLIAEAAVQGHSSAWDVGEKIATDREIDDGAKIRFFKRFFEEAAKIKAQNAKLAPLKVHVTEDMMELNDAHIELGADIDVNEIETLRKHVGLSQTSLSELIGVSRVSYSSWRGGAPIRKKNKIRLERVLSVLRDIVKNNKPSKSDLEKMSDGEKRIMILKRMMTPDIDQ